METTALASWISSCLSHNYLLSVFWHELNKLSIPFKSDFEGDFFVDGAAN